MSEETTEVQTDKEANFAALRAEREALEAELRPLKVEKAIRDAGFAPETAEGKALSRLLGVDADVEKVKELAAEIGFQAPEPKRELTPEERVTLAGSEKIAALTALSSSDEPPSIADQIADLAREIRALQAAGNIAESRRLNSELIALQTRAALSGGVRS